MVLWGRFVLGCQKVPRKVPPRFHQGCSSFMVSGFLVQISLELPTGSAEGSPKVSPRSHQGFTKVAKRFCRRFRGRCHQGCTMIFQVSSCLSMFLSGGSPWAVKGFVEGFAKVNPLLLGLFFGLISVCMTGRAFSILVVPHVVST